MFGTNSYFYLLLMSIAIILWLIKSREYSVGKSNELRNRSENITQGNDYMSESASLNLIIQAYLVEYETLREELMKRVEFASQVQIYSVLLLSAVLPLIEYVDFVSSQGGDAFSLFLLGALVFCALGWYQLDLDDRVANLENYILLILAPKLRNALSSISPKDQQQFIESILSWHLYWRTIRYNSIAGIWLSLGSVGKTGVAVLGATSLLGAYIYFEHIVLGVQWTLPRIGLAGIVLFGVIWMVVTGTLIRRKFANATQASLASKSG